MTLRTGLTTGTCAAAAAKAATIALLGQPVPLCVEVSLPEGDVVSLPIVDVRRNEQASSATAAVRKDAGDDADATHGLQLRATVMWQPSPDVTFAAGEGVGTVTKPGLQIPPGEPAINPIPRRMIAAAVREVTSRGVRVEISIPGGREVAAQTYNPRLGIEGGLSILGTTGIVRPYCQRAVLDALRCTVDVAAACGVTAPVLVPGNIGARAARGVFSLADEQVIEVGNAWGFVLDLIAAHPFRSLMLLGHPGKLAKLAEGHWNTHSSRSPSATGFLDRLCREALGHPAPASATAEGLFKALAPDERGRLAEATAAAIAAAITHRLAISKSASPLPLEGRGAGSESELRQAVHPSPPTPLPPMGEGNIVVYLIDMTGQRLGTSGDLTPWQ